MPAGYSDDATLTLTVPGGEVLTVGSTGHRLAELNNGGGIIAQTLWCPESSNGHHRGMFLAIVGQTGHAPGNPPRPLAPCGTWKITLEAKGFALDEEVHAWIQRDDFPLRRDRPARQSFFEHPEYTRYRPELQHADGSKEEGPLRRPGSLNALATGKGTIVVGSGFRKREDIPFYTGGGDEAATKSSITSGIPYGVDLAVTSDDSPLRLGQIVMGMRGGGMVRRYGTSLAAPMVTAYIAENMADFRAYIAPPAYKASPKEQMRQLVIKKMPIFVPMPPRHPRQGVGKLLLP